MTNEQTDELRAEIGRAPLITCEEERLLLKIVKEKGADSDEMKAALFDGLSAHLAVILEK